VEKVLKFNWIGSPAWWWTGKVLKLTTFSLCVIRVRILRKAPSSSLEVLYNSAANELRRDNQRTHQEAENLRGIPHGAVIRSQHPCA